MRRRRGVVVNDDEAAQILACRDAAWLPVCEKVKILLELQRQDYPLLQQQRRLQSWERPWDITA